MSIMDILMEKRREMSSIELLLEQRRKMSIGERLMQYVCIIIGTFAAWFIKGMGFFAGGIVIWCIVWTVMKVMG